jgi:hypothetical protein
MIYPPWNDEEVAALNLFQRDPNRHPFTCGGNRGDAAHVDYAKVHGDFDLGVLVAEKNGWKCPVCDYTQYWAHKGMMCK